MFVLFYDRKQSSPYRVSNSRLFARIAMILLVGQCKKGGLYNANIDGILQGKDFRFYKTMLG